MPRTDDLCDHVTKAVVYDLRSIGQFGLVAAVRREMHQCPLRGEAVKFLVPRSKLQALCYQQCPHKTPPTQCLQHSTSQPCVQHRVSALKIVSNTAKSVFKVCF